MTVGLLLTVIQVYDEEYVAAADADDGTLPRVTPVDNLSVTAATYLGATGADTITAVDVATDGTVIIGGSFPNYIPTGVTPIDLLGNTDATDAILRLDRSGRTPLSLTRLGDQLNDLALETTTSLVACGDFGVALLGQDAATLQWQAEPGTGKRCDIGIDGTVAALVGNQAYVYANDGTLLGNWNVGGNAQNDIAVAGIQQLVVATGYTQLIGNLQVAFVRAWHYDDTVAWTSYGYESVSGYGADTRGERVAIGRDGQLYFAGTINGGTGASIFARDPKDLGQSATDKTVKTDRFNDPFNIGSVKMTWYGRYDPAAGDLLLGQSLLTRLSSGRGNSITPRALMADAAGRLYIAGSKAADLDRRGDRQINGNAVGNYESGEAYLLVVSPDFTERIVWTPFARAGTSAGSSPATGVSVRDGIAALVLTQNNSKSERRLITTGNPLQAEPAGGDSDGYLALWPQVGVPTAPNAVTISPGFGYVGENTFTAQIEPVTVALPITYTWALNDVIIQQSVASEQRSDTLTYLWVDAANNQQLQVVVDNHIGSVARHYTFDVVAAEQLFLPVIRR